MIIGLTGKYCAGKNHIADILEERGLPVLDVDKLGYQVLETLKEELFNKFGFDLQKDDGSLDRRLLGQRVFGHPDKLAELEAIVHPEANRLTDEWVSAQNGHCVINAALLHKSSVFSRLDRIILVTAPLLTRFFRAKQRDRLPLTEISRRFTSQKDFNHQYLPINANHFYAEIYKVENRGLSKQCLYAARNQKLKDRVDKILEGIT